MSLTSRKFIQPKGKNYPSVTKLRVIKNEKPKVISCTDKGPEGYILPSILNYPIAILRPCFSIISCCSLSLFLHSSITVTPPTSPPPHMNSGEHQTSPPLVTPEVSIINHKQQAMGFSLPQYTIPDPQGPGFISCQIYSYYSTQKYSYLAVGIIIDLLQK